MSKMFNVYTGDGNFGVSFDYEIECHDLDEAVKIYMEGVDPEHRDLFMEEGDDEVALLTVYEGPNGERAYNGGALFCCEIRPADIDPRIR